MGWRDYGPRVPKPYDFVEIEPLGPGDRQYPAGHERYHPGMVSGRLEAALIVATPLHVSSGRVKMRKGKQPPLVREMTCVNGQPCVPASTLKGVVRSVVEAITRSCVRIVSARTDQLPRGAAACRDNDNLCLACRMFGALGFEGHVRFGDAVFDNGDVGIRRMPVLYTRGGSRLPAGAAHSRAHHNLFACTERKTARADCARRFPRGVHRRQHSVVWDWWAFLPSGLRQRRIVIRRKRVWSAKGSLAMGDTLR